jgi:hypothetical protein
MKAICLILGWLFVMLLCSLMLVVLGIAPLLSKPPWKLKRSDFEWTTC